MKKSLIQFLGLLGIVSFISYLCGVIFAPLAYPNYDWLSQAVSDLSAQNAPSLQLWNQLTALYNICEVVCVILVCISVSKNKDIFLLKLGIYLFGIMEFISSVGYRAFPLSTSGYAGTFIDVMHIIITIIVVLFSISSLIIIAIAGFKNRKYLEYSILALIALTMMLIGALGMKIVPSPYFGVVERFSVFAATGFNASLGLLMFLGKDNKKDKTNFNNINTNIKNES